MENPSFQQILKTSAGLLNQNLPTIFTLMTHELFSAAKLVWINFGQRDTPVSTNLFGDEADMFMPFFDREYTLMTTSICNNTECTEPVEESRVTHGLNKVNYTFLSLLNASIRCF